MESFSIDSKLCWLTEVVLFSKFTVTQPACVLTWREDEGPQTLFLLKQKSKV